MPSALVSLARAAAAPSERPPLAIGLDPVVAGPHVRVIPDAAARSLLAALHAEGALDLPTVARIADIDGYDPLGAILLMPGRAPGWTTVEGAELAGALRDAIPVVILVGRPSSLARTPAHLAGLLRAHAAEPSFVGSLPPDDPIAPDCPVAILERPFPSAAPPTVAALVELDRPGALLPHTLRALAEDDVAVTLIDRSGGGADAIPGAEVERQRPGEGPAAALARAADRSWADWFLHFSADERPVGPWAGIGLRDTVARFAARGWDAAAATVVLHPPLAEVPGRDPAELPTDWSFAAGAADAGRVALWRRGFGLGSPEADRARRAPWNVLLRRFTAPAVVADAPPSPFARDGGWLTDAEGARRVWLPWDEAAFAERFLVERLTGHGAFRRAFAVPPRCAWIAEERVLDWAGNLFKTAVGRLPSPDPMNPVPGSCLVRWETPDGSAASLFVARPGQPERFAARAAHGTVSIDLIQPNGAHYARLYDGDDRRRLLGELRFGFTMDLDE